MMDGTLAGRLTNGMLSPTGRSTSGSVSPTSASSAAAAAYNIHQQLTEASRLFQQNVAAVSQYQAAAAAGAGMSPFGNHLGALSGMVSQHHHQQHQQAQHQMGGGVNAMSQMHHGLSNQSSQQIAAALFASSPLISDDLKLAAAAAAAAAAAQAAQGKKTHRGEPVPQSGFKGVSWNSRMKAWLAFYVTENGERKSKTFSTRKLGMEEARLQAITFCKQRQDQRREARKRKSEMQSLHQHGSSPMGELGGGNGQSSSLDKLCSDDSMMDSPRGQMVPSDSSSSSMQRANALRCGGCPTAPVNMRMSGGGMCQSPTQSPSHEASGSDGSAISYVPIVPIALNMIERSGLLQPLELNVLPPCQHCNKQPYPFLMIVSEGQEQSYSVSSIMSLASQSQSGSLAVPGQPSCDEDSVDEQQIEGQLSQQHEQDEATQQHHSSLQQQQQDMSSLVHPSNSPSSPGSDHSSIPCVGRSAHSGMLRQQQLCKQQCEESDEGIPDENHNHQSLLEANPATTSPGGMDGSIVHHLYDLRPQVVSQMRDAGGGQQQGQQPQQAHRLSHAQQESNCTAQQNAVNVLLGMSNDPNGSMRLSQHLSHQLDAINTADLLRLTAPQQHSGRTTDGSSLGEDEHHAAPGGGDAVCQQMVQNLRAAGYTAADAASAARQLLGLTLMDANNHNPASDADTTNNGSLNGCSGGLGGGGVYSNSHQHLHSTTAPPSDHHQHHMHHHHSHSSNGGTLIPNHDSGRIGDRSMDGSADAGMLASI